MNNICACCTLFISDYGSNPTEIAAHYEAIAEPANGYLIRLQHEVMLVDATAAETADWARQIELATALADENTVALSIFLVGDLWALALAHNERPGPVAAFTPDNTKVLEQLPHSLLAIERQLIDFFPDRVDEEAIDQIFGAMLERAISPGDGISEVAGSTWLLAGLAALELVRNYPRTNLSRPRPR